MSTFKELDHPRSTDGKFAAKSHGLATGLGLLDAHRQLPHQFSATNGNVCLGCGELREQLADGTHCRGASTPAQQRVQEKLRPVRERYPDAGVVVFEARTDANGAVSAHMVQVRDAWGTVIAELHQLQDPAGGAREEWLRELEEHLDLEHQDDLGRYTDDVMVRTAYEDTDLYEVTVP